MNSHARYTIDKTLRKFSLASLFVDFTHTRIYENSQMQTTKKREEILTKRGWGGGIPQIKF